MYNILPENKFNSGGETLVISSSRSFTAKVSPAIKPVVSEDDPETTLVKKTSPLPPLMLVKSRTSPTPPLPPVTAESKGIDVYGVPGSNESPSDLLTPNL